MGFAYVSVEEAIEADGLRMVVLEGVPSGWTEAAKGIFRVKGIDWAAVRLVYGSEPLKKWAGQRNAPVVVYGSERPRYGWTEILLLAERLAPTPALLPCDATQRALMFGLAHEICSEWGLGWARRVQLVHASLTGLGGFPEDHAKWIGMKYGYSPEAGVAAGQRVAELLQMLAARLHAQRAAGSRYYVGNAVTAVDIYSATFAAMFSPLPQEQCEMLQTSRAAFELRDAQTEAALDPILFAHRDMMYATHLQLPLSL